jgi:hypothetical protein
VRFRRPPGQDVPDHKGDNDDCRHDSDNGDAGGGYDDTTNSAPCPGVEPGGQCYRSPWRAPARAGERARGVAASQLPNLEAARDLICDACPVPKAMNRRKPFAVPRRTMEAHPQAALHRDRRFRRGPMRESLLEIVTKRRSPYGYG